MLRVDRGGVHSSRRTSQRDALARGDRSQDLDGEAHSWLCAPPGSLLGREVSMLAGFRWGFQLRAGEVAIAGPSTLEPAAWKREVEIMELRCPGWRFVPGS